MTECFVAPIAVTQASRAVIAVASAARATALATGVPPTVFTAARAVAADRSAAVVAAHRLLGRRDIPTIPATRTLPVIERDVGAACVVGLQDLANEHEEVVDPALLKCPADSQAALSFAKRLILHVWMRHAAVVCCGSRLQSSDAVGMSSAEFGKFERNLETSQLDAVQCGGQSHGRKRSLTLVVANLVKLLVQGCNFTPNVSQRWRSGVQQPSIYGASQLAQLLDRLPE